MQPGVPDQLLALSFLQPWLWAILDRHKGFTLDGAFYAIENRSKPPPRKMVGQRFALHASAGWDAAGERFVDDQLLGGAESPPRTICDRGAIVGTARLVGALSLLLDRSDPRVRHVGVSNIAGDSPRGALDHVAQSAWAFGPWVWLLTDLRELSRPVPAKGMLGFWKVSPDVAALAAALEVSA